MKNFEASPVAREFQRLLRKIAEDFAEEFPSGDLQKLTFEEIKFLNYRWHDELVPILRQLTPGQFCRAMVLVEKTLGFRKGVQ